MMIRRAFIGSKQNISSEDYNYFVFCDYCCYNPSLLDSHDDYYVYVYYYMIT